MYQIVGAHVVDIAGADADGAAYILLSDPLQILETGLELKRKRTVSDAELMPLSSLLLEWSGGWIRRYGGSNRKKDVAIRK